MTTANETIEPRRALALDALRGIAILLMVFSGRIPYGTLPDWMYHAQVPPPNHVFNPNLPGITWVDLVFPFFLFAMGAAIPLALSRRIERKESMASIVLSVFLRGLLLASFALYVMHIRPWLFGARPSSGAWMFSLGGFLLLFPMYAQLPSQWTRWLRWTVRGGGWICAIALMAFMKLPDGSGFLVTRSDIIILVLSNVAVAGALLWLVTRENWILRLGFLGILIAVRVSAPVDGWVHWLWNISPAPWLFRVYFLQYLFLVLPGTIAGDMLIKWMKAGRSSETNPSWTASASAMAAFLMVMITVVVVVGLKARWVVGAGVGTIVLLTASWYLVRKAVTSTEVLIRTLLEWGAFWIVLGLVFEPFEGGIKKDHPTMSYYFVTAGLSIIVLIALTIAIDVLHQKKFLSFFVLTGQNPLVAYAGIHSLVPPVLGLVGLDTIIESITPTPWLGVLRGAFMTYLVAIAAVACTKRKILLKT